MSMSIQNRNNSDFGIALNSGLNTSNTQQNSHSGQFRELSSREQRKLAIVGAFSSKIDQCLNSINKIEDVDSVKKLLNGLLSEYDERVVPDDYQEVFKTLKCYLENKSPVLKWRGISQYRETLFNEAEDAALLKILVTTKISEKLDQLDL